MTNIITGSQSLDPILTGLFYQSVQAASDYKGLTAAPPKAIDGYTGQYLALSSRPRLSLDQTDDAFGSNQLNALGLNDTSMPTGISFETKTVSLDRYARNVFVNARDVAQDALAHKILGVHAHKVFQGIYSTASSYGDGSGSGAGSHVVDGPDLNTTTADIVDPILTGCQEIYDAEGRYPNFAFVNPIVANLLRLNDDVRARPNQGGSDATLATSDALGAFFNQMFGVQLVVVPATFKAADGTTGRFMGDHISLAYLDGGTASPTFACTFVEQGTDVTGDGATLAGIREETIEDPQGVKIIADVMFRAQVENSGAGYMIKDVTS
jgi:hypothetical protein